MHMLHLTAFISASALCPPAPVPVRPEPGHAPAFKAAREAGRRGGESTARQDNARIYFLHPSVLQRVTLSRAILSITGSSTLA